MTKDKDEDNAIHQVHADGSIYTILQYERDRAHKIRPSLDNCKIGWKARFDGDHEYCLTHERWYHICELEAIARKKS